MSTPQQLEARPSLGSNNEVTWTLCKKVQGGADVCGSTPDTYPSIDLGKGAGATPIQVRIAQDNTGLGIRFSNDPLWIQKDTKPTCSVIDSQIEQVNGAGTQLTFVDKNSEEILLKYQLNFVDQAGQAVTSIDPDIKNGGGQIIDSSNNFLADYSTQAVIALAVLVFLIGGFIGALIRGRASGSPSA